MSVPTRKIGNTEVSALGFGAMGISAYYGATDPDEERFKVLDATFSSGCTFWDTSDAYGDSEELIGKWFKGTGNRDKIFLATKFGIARDADGNRVIKGSPEYVREACERSLERLGVDQIDLYYVHRVDQTRPIEQTVRALAELVREGKIKHIGLSEVSSASIRRAHAVHPIAAVQMEYSPFCLDIESPNTGVLQTCRELGIAVVAYSPLGRGLLTGMYKGPEDFEEGDFRRSIPMFSKENFPHILDLASGLQAIGKKHNATAGQVCLAWVLAQGSDIIPIPGTRRIKYLEENMGSLNVQLTDEDLKEIRKYIENSSAIQGDRYDKVFMQTTFADTPAE